MKNNDDTLKVNGTIMKILNGSMFRIETEQGFEVLAMPSGKMRKFNIKLALGDKVEIEMSTYDLTKGRITYRFKN